MSVASLVARDELRLMRRNRVAMIACALLVLLTLVTMASSWAHQRGIEDLRARHQHEAQDAFDSQPDRHPHRMVHYGTFIFRPLSALAAFDPGVDAFTGNSMFLEGHRQNTANFGDVQSELAAGTLRPVDASLRSRTLWDGTSLPVGAATGTVRLHRHQPFLLLLRHAMSPIFVATRSKLCARSRAAARHAGLPDHHRAIALSCGGGSIPGSRCQGSLLSDQTSMPASACCNHCHKQWLRRG